MLVDDQAAQIAFCYQSKAASGLSKARLWRAGPIARLGWLFRLTSKDRPSDTHDFSPFLPGVRKLRFGRSSAPGSGSETGWHGNEEGCGQ